MITGIPKRWSCWLLLAFCAQGSAGDFVMVGNDAVQSSTGLASGTRVLILKDLTLPDGIVYAVEAYFRNTLSFTLQTWEEQSVTGNDVTMQLKDQVKISPPASGTQKILMRDVVGDNCLEVDTRSKLGILIKDFPSSAVYTYNFANSETIYHVYENETNLASVGSEITFDLLTLPIQFSINVIVYTGGQSSQGGDADPPSCSQLANLTYNDIVTTAQPTTTDLYEEPVGPPGLPGPKGEAGTPGSPGAKGAIGPPGLDGVTGSRGLQGLTGPTGPQGPQGSSGPGGNPGERGSKGAQGSKGLKGDSGIPGIDGIPGQDGSVGLKGSKGNIGVPGVIGPPGAGLKGSRGEPGVEGIQGPPGPPGNDGSNSNGAPQSGASTGDSQSDSLVTSPVIICLLIWNCVLTVSIAIVCVMNFRRNHPVGPAPSSVTNNDVSVCSESELMPNNIAFYAGMPVKRFQKYSPNSSSTPIVVGD